MKSFNDLAKYNNTSAIHDGDTWMVRLHNTNIFKMVEHESGRVITLDSGGWKTTTTKKRINEAFESIGLPFVLYQDKGEWYIQLGNIGPTVQFSDGMVLQSVFGRDNLWTHHD